MRVLLHILLAFSCQLLAVSCQQTSCTVPEPVEGTTSGTSTSSAISYPTTVDCCPLSVDYYEKQIHIADSLYKNYLPQYNFEEVKAAVGFFDSLRLTTDNSQQTTDFFHRFRKNKSSQYLSNSQTLCNSDAYPRTVDCCPLTVDIEFLCARAHYYHAVGLTERDDIVGACEHYLKALEIMEFETENLRTSKSESILANGKRLKSKGKEKEKAHGSQLEANGTDYEKIRFMSLIYTRLGHLFLNGNYCDLAILKYKKALRYVDILENNDYKSLMFKFIGNTYQLSNEADSALYYYNKSLEIGSLNNRIDIEKSIAKLLFEKGEKDTAYYLIKKHLNEINDLEVRYSYYATIGEMYYKEDKYDSALYYLKLSLESKNKHTILSSSDYLSRIYEFYDDLDMKYYYDEISISILKKEINNSINTAMLQSLYKDYCSQKNNRDKNKATKLYLTYIILGTLIVIILIITMLYLRYKYQKEEIISKTNEEIKRRESEINELVEIIGSLKSDINSLKNEVDTKEEEISCKENDIKKMENDLSAKERELKRLQENVHESRILINKLNENHKTNEERIAVHLEEIEKLKTEINQAQNNLNDLRFKNSFTEGKIKKQNAELKKKEELIGKYTAEISNLKYRLERKRIDVSNLNNYLQSDICFKILNEINELSDKRLKSNMLSPLSKEEFVLLLNSANHHLNYFINDMAKKYPKLKKEDLYYLCFVIMGLDNNQIASLFGVTYDTAKKREKKICVIFDLDPKGNLSNYLLHLV